MVISASIEALFEIDEVSSEPLPDGRVRVVFVTTGLHPDLAKVKTAIWAMLSPPAQKVDEVKVYEVQRGPIAKRYRVEVVMKPLLKGIREDRSLGIRELIAGRGRR